MRRALLVTLVLKLLGLSLAQTDSAAANHGSGAPMVSPAGGAESRTSGSADSAIVHVELRPRAEDPSKHVEVFWTRPHGNGPWPLIMFLHGHQDGIATPGGKAFVDYGVLEDAAKRGYVGVAVSQPGYGHSDGPADFMGPFTVGAVEEVLAYFRGQPFVRRDRIALEGVSRGAVVAGLAAAHDRRIRAIVLISGAYDLAALYGPHAAPRGTALADSFVTEMRSDVRRETDGSTEALEDRSVLHVAGHIRAAAMILNGAQDFRTDPRQSRALATAIRRNGVFARAIIYPEFGHAIPYDRRERDVRPFLDHYLGQSVMTPPRR